MASVLSAVAAHWRNGERWYRAESSGERVTLAALYRNGYLNRRAWRLGKSSSDNAHEYRPGTGRQCDIEGNETNCYGEPIRRDDKDDEHETP
jgi:hypothetical protein